MNTSPDLDPSAPFQLGDWQVDPGTGRLRKTGVETRLEPKVMQVLVYLAQHPNQVVSREVLEAKAWRGVIVGYDAVTQSIIKLRKALGDDSRHPRYIETLPKRGYRLIAPVSRPSRGEALGAASQATPSASAPPGKSPQSEGARKRRLAAGVGLIAIIGGLLFLAIGPDGLNRSPDSRTARPSIVVLPFKNLSDDPRHAHLSDGITDDLITDLAKVASIRVIAPQSSYYYKHHPARLEEVSRELNVAYIVEGTLRKAEERIRVNIQLTDTRIGESVWAKRFDFGTDQIFQAQDDIAQNVISALAITPSRGAPARLGSRGTQSFEAYDAFLVGQQHIEARSKQGYARAVSAYRRAIEIDPDYARAYGAMAVTLTRGYRYQWTDLALVEARERALELAERAVALDQSTPQIYWSLGYVHLHRREFDAAETAARQSIALSPNYADGYALLANISSWRGRATDAVNHITKAIALNPHYSFQYPSTLGLAYYLLGRHEEAVAALRRALAQNESALNPRLFLAAAHVRTGRQEEAAWEIEQITTNRPDATLSDLRVTLPFEHHHDLKTLLEDLRNAGLPD